MNFDQMRFIINLAVDTQDFVLVETVINVIKEESPDVCVEMLWQFAFEHAIDIGSLSVVQEIDRRFYHDFGSGNKDLWTIYRSSHQNHLDLVEHFVTEKKKEGICAPYIFDEIARAGASNNNKEMVAYALSEICEQCEDQTDKHQRDEIFNLLADRSGPIKTAATAGHVDMLKYLVSVVEFTLSEDQRKNMSKVISEMSPFYYGRNVAKSENHLDVVNYIDSLMTAKPKHEATHRFFSQHTRMEVGGAHLTDTAMADFYLKMKAH